MAAPQRIPEGVAADLREERAAMQAFLDLLQEEQASLLRGDADAVGALLARKSGWLQKLAGLAERRRGFLRAQSYPADRRGMDHWLSAQPTASALAAEWQALLQLTHQACQANDANGALIAMRMQSNQQALAALTTAARSSALYGKDGQAVGAWGSRPLGAA
jgi:flagellar biosynthesis/type III secretory pathway chaperone